MRAPGACLFGTIDFGPEELPPHPLLSLEEAGYDVQEAANGAEGIRAFRKAPADLVITDIFMPGCDGVEVIQALRRVDPEVKILAVTGRSDTSDFLKVARMLGASACFISFLFLCRSLLIAHHFRSHHAPSVIPILSSLTDP
jgi:CheY-like chemotaxis protein